MLAASKIRLMERSVADSFLAAFRKQVVASPDRLALQDGSLAMSYQDLDAATDAVARQLHESGLRIGSVVGYTGGCGAGRVIAYIASWKAGTTFVWLDPAMPEPALLDLMENSQAEAIMIESEAQRSAAQTLGAPPIVLPSPWPTRPETPPFVLAEPIGHINAYIRSTSGSTGKPKGVRSSGASKITRTICTWTKSPSRQTSAPRSSLIFGPAPASCRCGPARRCIISISTAAAPGN